MCGRFILILKMYSDISKCLLLLLLLILLFNLISSLVVVLLLNVCHSKLDIANIRWKIPRQYITRNKDVSHPHQPQNSASLMHVNRNIRCVRLHDEYDPGNAVQWYIKVTKVPHSILQYITVHYCTKWYQVHKMQIICCFPWCLRLKLNATGSGVENMTNRVSWYIRLIV